MIRCARPVRLMILGIVTAAFSGCGSEVTPQAEAALAATAPDDEAKIVSAMSAAPEAIARHATIRDWPGEEGGEMRVIRAGTNGWICLPDRSDTEGNDPMCLDEPWVNFMHALMTGTEPRIDRLGMGYMIAEGGVHSSNTDPYASGPTPDNEWGFDGPHLMIVVPDAAALEGLPTTRDSGGPYVMYSGTPYAHVMVPVQ